MKRRMTAEAFKEYKQTYNTLHKAGYNPSQIRDILKIGNGTVAYIARADNFKQYCQMRDEVLARAKAKAGKEKALHQKAVQTAMVVADIEKKPTVGRPRTVKAVPVTPKEAPVNIEKLVQAHFDDFRNWLKTDYTKIIVTKVAKAASISEIDEQISKKEQPAKKSWFKRK